MIKIYDITIESFMMMVLELQQVRTLYNENIENDNIKS